MLAVHVLICFLIAYVSHPNSLAIADSIHGCGGFVEASAALIKSRKATDPKFDYSHITVELKTVDGLVKDRTQCAPNGYYFIPVYDKGSFLVEIKGPEGWSWNPDKVQVTVDHTGCNANEDINFCFTGFTLSGRVTGAVGGESCSVNNGGPSNVNVKLLSPNGDTISSVSTSREGSYSFKNVISGRYELQVSNHSLKIDVRGSTEVELGFGNGLIDDIFFVPGYDIQGFVVAQGNPILGVHIYLHSKDVVAVSCPQGSGDVLAGQSKALCHAVSDADGMFAFKSVPCGVYELVPYYKGENTVFDVSPSSISLSVEHQHITVLQKFQVTGFSIGGRVVDGNNVGVSDVTIIVNGNERSFTDKEGYYKLDQVTSNHYMIEANKEHYKFDNLKDFLVLPNMSSVANIKAISYDVCGVVRIRTTGYKAKVALTHGPENVKPQVKQTDGSGKFCFEVSPGEYRLSALAAIPESATGLLFLPSYVDIGIRSPVLNVEFSQALVNVGGSVACKEKCGPSVSVNLISQTGGHKGKKKTLRLTDPNNEFLFSDVFPGKYRLEVIHISPEATFEEDSWCWEQSFIDVDIGAEDKEGILFVQKGYWVNVFSTHNVDASIIAPNGVSVDMKIQKGSQRLCIEFPGVHELHFVNSCIFFGSTSVKIDTLNLLPLYFRGEKYRLNGKINIELSSLNGLNELPKDIIVDVRNNEDIVVDSAVARLAGESNKENIVDYEYSLWANLGEKLSFVPYDSRDSGEKKILFYPRQHHVSVINDGCQASIPQFSGQLGLYIEGLVSPPLFGVHISIIAAGDSLNSPLRKGQLAVETSTGSDGLYVAGPLYHDINYTVEAFKPGYHLKSFGLHSFSCQKLSQISVQIYSEVDANEPFPSVLLSLSGEDGYRNNSVTASGGLFVFDSLFPGSFYLRPLLKEYAFYPSAEAIELGSGESKEIIFQATRVAFSATGVVTLLSGQPKEGVSIEARSESKGYYEETITGYSGNYRLRGLLPDTLYIIKIIDRDNPTHTKIERASPESVEIKVDAEDIRGLNFVVFEPPETTILSCTVEGKRIRELQPHLRVEIKSANDPSKIESVIPLPLSNFFQVKHLPKVKLLLKLESSLPSNRHRFESEVIEVDLEKHTQIHVGPLRYKIEEDYHKQELTTQVYPLIIGISVIAFIISMPRLNDLYQSSSGSTVSVKKVSSVRKKTY